MKSTHLTFPQFAETYSTNPFFLETEVVSSGEV